MSDDEINKAKKDLVNNQLNQFGLGEEKKPKPKRNVYDFDSHDYRGGYYGSGYRRTRFDDDDDDDVYTPRRPVVEHRAGTNSQGQRSIFDKMREHDEAAGRVKPQTRAIVTPERTYLKSEAEARLETFAATMRAQIEGSHVVITKEQREQLIEEIMMAVGDFIEKAGLIWATQGRKPLKECITTLVETAYYMAPGTGEILGIKVKK